MDAQRIKETFEYALDIKMNVFFKEERYYNSLMFYTDEQVKNESVAGLKRISNIQELESTTKNKGVSSFHVKTEDFYPNCFKYIYKKASPERKKELLKTIGEYLNYRWQPHILSVLEETAPTYKEVINTINSFPISVWSARSLEFQDMEDLLQKYKTPDKDLDKFWLKFFKARKNQLKNSFVGPDAKDFLIRKYGRDEEKLRPYFDFSNHVKSEFEQIDFQLEEPTAKYVTTLRVNCRKAANILCIPEYSEGKIAHELKDFALGLKPLLGFDEVSLSDYDRHKSIVELRIYNNKKQYSQEEISGLIKEFLLYKKTNHEVQTNESTVRSWYLQRELNEKLNNNKEEIIIKRKNKI